MTRPVLILLNGAPASGKSTLARAWVERHGAALPLAIDMDVLRSMLGGWQDDATGAGLAARALALAAIRTHLASGRDVVVPQYLRRPEFIEQLREAAGSAAFLECALVVEPSEADARFDQRRADAERVAGPYSAVIHGDLMGESMTAVVTDFEAFLRDRPQTVRLSGTLAELLDALDQATDAVKG